jgi:hypothetical protein
MNHVHRGGLLSLFISCLILIFLAPSVSADRVPLAIDIGGGVLFPWDGDHRDIYGSGPALSLGISPRLPRADTWFLFELGFVRSSGREFSFDPTFELPEETYWLFPVSVGLRTNAFRSDPPSPIRFYIGAAAETVFTWWKRENDETFNTPTVGVVFEMRPEVAVSETWSVWVRNRLDLLGGVEYRGSGIPEINYSGNTLQLGLSYRVQ